MKKSPKKLILIISNVIAFIILLVMEFIEAIRGDAFFYEIMFKYFMGMCGFAFMSAIVYYLSIIADAIGKKTANKPDDQTDKSEKTVDG